jgi:Fe-S-cluster containining protein
MRCENLQDHWETIRDEIPDLGDDWVSCFNPGFLKYPLIWDGKYISKNCIRCPKTCDFLMKITEDMAYRAGYSLIRAHSKLKIHTDTPNLRADYLYTLNLCLKCPEKCKLHHIILGTVEHQDGILMKYEATELHGVENNSDEDLYIFYVEVSPKSES